jgi:hypothetical protein
MERHQFRIAIEKLAMLRRESLSSMHFAQDMNKYYKQYQDGIDDLWEKLTAGLQPNQAPPNEADPLLVDTSGPPVIHLSYDAVLMDSPFNVIIKGNQPIPMPVEGLEGRIIYITPICDIIIENYANNLYKAAKK